MREGFDEAAFDDAGTALDGVRGAEELQIPDQSVFPANAQSAKLRKFIHHSTSAQGVPRSC
ncbi:MAG: hypothetical protein J5X22_22695 [Candidatus Accumulibacter sp.]|uniref:Uncharacterized protein n=2 Tax=Candidatus Accumulibacter TaxID=327159 RepID=A0A7D5SFI0_9PROT|nr:hypothetical protein [Accumulibacter sp.]MBO3713177.1 hypothetical protein [Accumulibacter sp.]MCM8623555.1 hypothetical protein [Accumulibacter sp.]QLH52197.1 MAG: hypothetical protein HWD57_22250 [Candidatus Accumulibacter cognatus]TMQ76334.1 hypothetical protein ACCUM_4428 [Candidatus Accumulibacter phosphatis]